MNIPLGTRIPPFGTVVGTMRDSQGLLYVFEKEGSVTTIDEDSVHRALVNIGAGLRPRDFLGEQG